MLCILVKYGVLATK